MIEDIMQAKSVKDVMEARKKELDSDMKMMAINEMQMMHQNSSIRDEFE